MSKKIFTAVFAGFLCSTLSAQDTSRLKLLEEVVITATKFPVKQSITGKVVDVISRQELESLKGKTLSQVLNERAGLVVGGALNNLGSPQTIYMRGAASGRTLVVIDGIPAYDPSQINNEFDPNLIALNEIERIEICRCAQSTLYGSDAIAGVINIITVNNTSGKPLNVRATLAGGNLGTFKGNAQVYGKLNRFNYAVKYSRLSTNGFSAAYDSTAKGNFDRDDYLSNNASAQLTYQVNDQLSLRGFVQVNRYSNGIDANAFVDDHDFRGSNKNLVSGASFNFKKAFLSLTGNYQYSEVYRTYIDDSSYIPAGSFSKYSKNYYYGKSQFAELFSSIPLGGGFTLLEGADYRFTSMNSEYVSGFSSRFKDTSLSQSSLYASITYSGPDSNLNMEIGGRLNVHSRYGSNYTYTFNPSYRLSNHFRVFGTVATAFKAPSLYQLYDGFSGNSSLQAEESMNFEVGITQQHAVITNRVVAFYRNIRNGIDYNYLLFKYFNFAKQQAKGLEWEVNIQPASFLTIGWNYTYLSIRETTQNRVTQDQDTVYKYAIKRPRHNVNAHIDFHLLPDLTVSINGKHVSDRYDLGGYARPDVLLEAYTLLGAHANYMLNEHISLFADAQNITNKKFFDARGYQAIPFIAVGGITLNW